MASIKEIKGLGSATAVLLEKLNIFNTDDLLFHLPRDYEDRSTIIPMNQIQVGRSYLLEGRVKSIDFPAGKRKSMAVLIEDDFGRITLRFYHIYHALIEKFKQTTKIRVFGEVRVGARGLEMYHPETQTIQQNTPLPQTQLTAIYPSTDGLTQIKLRQYIQYALKHFSNELPELLPKELSPYHYQLKDALHYIHHPPTTANMHQLAQGTHPAQQRLIFEELVAHQLSLLTRRAYVQKIKAPIIRTQHHLVKKLLSQLPFKPTTAQQRVSQEILKDLQLKKPMLRLIQGDVGAGKTLVSAIAGCHVLEAGYQVALMAPTEILAEQHYLNFKKWFEPFGIQVSWLSGKQKRKARQLAEETIQSGQSQLIIGTHALFQDNIQFHHLGLIIIDEQHRFGVDQRLALRNKGKKDTPHQLIMTATPIPRTLAMSTYGDLDTSIIDELPPGRSPITTVTIPIERRENVLERIIKNCAEGKQAYWVCTLVEQSETLDAQAAEATFQELQNRFSNLNIGLVHGKMKPLDKQHVMQQFKDNQLQLLIATTVIEVGVDVPNATLMVIENAERLGLSQLHQLRGRVGRGSQASFCVLLYKTPLSKNGYERLSVLKQTTDGFMIAEKDLEIRGPGELLGTKQTGDMGFRVVKLQRDSHLLEQAQDTAKKILQHFPQHTEALLNRWLPEAPRYAYI